MARLLGYEVPDELAAYVAQRQAPPDMAGVDAALAQDRKAREREGLADVMFNAGALIRGERPGAPKRPEIPSAVQEFMLRRQMSQPQGPEPLDVLSKITGIEDVRGRPERELAKARAEAEARAGERGDERKWKEGESAKDRASRERAAAIAAGRQERVEETKAKREGIKDTMNLRKEFQADPIVKSTKEMAQAIAKIRNVPDTGTGDLSLIYSYVKILDPGSVVREGEIALSREPTPLLAALTQKYKRAAQGELLHPDLRRSYKEAAEQLFKAQLETYQPVADEYGRLASQLGLDPSSVTLDLGFRRGSSRPRVDPAQGPAAAPAQRPRRTVDGETREWDGSKWVPVGG